VQGMIEALEKSSARLRRRASYSWTWRAFHLDDVREFVKMSGKLHGGSEAIDDRKTLEQMKQEKILAALAEMVQRLSQCRRFIETLYNSLMATKANS